MRNTCWTVVVALALAMPAAGQLIEAEGAPDPADVLREVEPQPEPYGINSAIVLTNPSAARSAFKIELFDNDGAPAGGGSVVVAPRGLEVIWVSTLLAEEGRRFVGWGVARSEAPLQCNAFLVGIGTSPLPVEDRRVRSADAAARRVVFSVLAAL